MKTWLIILGCAFIYIGCKDEKHEDKPAANPAHVQLVHALTEEVRQHPDSSPVRMRLADALDSLGDYTQALVQLDTLIMNDSLNNGLWFRRGQLQEAINDTTGALKSYQRAVHIYPSIDAQLSLANLLAERKDVRCLDICQSILKMGVDRETSAHCYFISGIYYSRTNNADKAITMFDQCINNNYTYMEAYMEKGFVYFDNKKYKEAQQVFDRAITVNNMYADGYYWRAKTQEAMGNKQEAIIDYQRSLGLDKGLKEAKAALDRLGGS
jgi:tetratricopeptide (TPR) repeat protein